MRQFFNAAFFPQRLVFGVGAKLTPNLNGFVGTGIPRPHAFLMRFKPPGHIRGDPGVKHISLASENIDPPPLFKNGHDQMHPGEVP